MGTIFTAGKHCIVNISVFCIDKETQKDLSVQKFCTSNLKKFRQTTGSNRCQLPNTLNGKLNGNMIAVSLKVAA